MRHKRLNFSAGLLLGLGIEGLQAQESVNATGGNTSGSGGSVSYSVGQFVSLGAWNRDVYSYDSNLFRDGGNKELGIPVRCLRD